MGITFVVELHNFDQEECGKVPVVTGLYVVEELEESEREAIEISRGRWCSSSESAKVSPLCREIHALTDPQYGAQFPATKTDVNMYFVTRKASNQLKLTLKAASVFNRCKADSCITFFI